MRAVRAGSVAIALLVAGYVSAADVPVAETWVPSSLAAWRPGLDMVHSGRHEAGLDWILTRLGEQPGDTCGEYLAALVHLEYEIGGADEAEREAAGEQHLERGLDAGEKPDDAGSRYCTGALLGLRSKHRVQEGSYVGAAFDGKAMRRTMLDLLDEHPTCVDCKFWLGVYDYYAAVLPRYIKFFRGLLFLPSGDRERGIAQVVQASQDGTVERYSALWVLSDIYADDGQKQERRDLLQRLNELYPYDVGAAAVLAGDYSQVDPRDPAAGVAVMRSLIERFEAVEDPHAKLRLRDAHADLGRLLQRSIRYDEAESELRRALELADGDARESVGIGETLVRTLNFSGRHAEAVAVYGELERRYPEAQKRALRRDTFEFDEATSRMALALAPARRLAWEGERAQAEALYEELLTKTDDATQVHLWLGELYFGERRWAQAEARYREIAELAPEMPKFLAPFTALRLGQICDLTDRRGEAKRHYTRARDIAGDYDRYASAAEFLLKNRYGGE